LIPQPYCGDAIVRSRQLDPCLDHPAPSLDLVPHMQRGARENGMRYDSAYADLAVRDAEIKAHAAFRKRLYDHDVVPEALEAAASLTSWPQPTAFLTVR
jgi:hypothetical protein